MNKTCARCEKIVYPIEEFKCLDKVWHKGCFKCQGCGMTLNMKTYKGYNKQPYCEAHIPKVKATTMAETPELKRIAENTKIQSNVKYHADFEKSKGKFTQVADDPETLRIKQNTRIISNAAYHGDLAKKAVMEKQRTINDNGELIDGSETKDTLFDNYLNNTNSIKIHNTPSVSESNTMMNTQQAQDPYQSQSQSNAQNNYTETDLVNTPVASKNFPRAYNVVYNTQYQQVGSENTNSYQNVANANSTQYQSNEAVPSQQQRYNSNQSGTNAHNQQGQSVYQPNSQYYTNRQNYISAPYGSQPDLNQAIGKIADYDPITDGPRNTTYTSRQSSTLIYSSDRGAVSGQPRRIGSVADMDPVNYEYNAMSSTPTQNIQQSGHVYRALYDYSAQDVDEVSFMDGDLIVNVSCIDEGWMTGTVQRTGHTGMLPANYVEVAHI